MLGHQRQQKKQQLQYAYALSINTSDDSYQFSLFDLIYRQ